MEDVTNALNGNSYRCVVTNTFGEEPDQVSSVTSSAAQLTVKTKSHDMNISTNFSTTTDAEAGVELTLRVDASTEAGDTLTYQWYRRPAAGGAQILLNGATSATYTIPASAIQVANDGDLYRCAITNPTTGTTEYRGTTLNIWDPAKVPTITEQPVSIEQETGTESIRLSIAAETQSEEQELKYQWQKYDTASGEWKNIERNASAQTAEFVNTRVSEALNGQYRCLVWVDGAKEQEIAISDVATVVIWTPNVPYFVQNVEDATAYVGGTATFTVEAKVNTGANLFYQWYNADGDVAIEGATSASYTTDILTLDDTGAQYYCVVYNNAMGTSATSATATLTVEEATEPATPEMFPTEESGLKVDAETGLVTGLAATDTANTAADVISMFTATQGASIVIKDAAGNEVAEDAAVGTGYTVNLVAADGTTAQSVTLVIKGDVNGDGVVGIGDLVLAAQGNTLEGAYAVAADMNEDGAVGIGDLVLLAQA